MVLLLLVDFCLDLVVILYHILVWGVAVTLNPFLEKFAFNSAPFEKSQFYTQLADLNSSDKNSGQKVS